ncbi:MAG: TIGR02281 family clan AA aspartic protease [Pseudomonadota bacterium]
MGRKRENQRAPSMIYWPVFVVAVIAVALFITEPPNGNGPEDYDALMRLIYLGVLAVGLVFASLGRLVLSDGWRTVHYGMVWCAVAVGLTAAYAEQDLLRRSISQVRGDVMPTVAVSTIGVEEVLERSWDGHYRSDVAINGSTVSMMVDTGASMVVLPYEDVSRVGIDPTALQFNMPVSTANGRSHVAPIELSEIRLGDIVVRDVPAAVAHPGRLHTGLLGMSFLDRLSETSFQGKRLFLRQTRVMPVAVEPAGLKR